MRRALLLMAIGLGACAFSPALPEWASGAPDWVLNRRPLPACGEERINAADIDHDEVARRCLIDAFHAGADAELIAIEGRDEGELVRLHRVHSNGAVEVFARLPADELGPLRWERYVCDGLTPVEDVTRLPDLPSDQIFQPIGCEPMPVD